jgi:protein-S-isoprenylcysteine O-methyltransferase Ste14
MVLDVRWPMGAMFVLLGAVLVVTGLMAPAAANERSLGVNITLWWGLVMLLLGAAMLGLAARARARAKRIPHPPHDPTLRGA